DVGGERAAAEHAVEIEPGGAAQVPRIAHQSRAAEVLAEQSLGELDRLVRRRAIQPVRAPGLLARLDDHRRQLGAELVRVDLEPAVLGLLERERKGREPLRRAQPDETALAHIDARLESRRVLLADAAVDT